MKTQAKPPKGSWWRFWKREFWSHKNNTRGGLLVFLLLTTQPVKAVEEAVGAAGAEERPVEYFSRLPDFWDPDLSPDGSRVTYRTTLDGSVVLVVHNLESGEVVPLLGSDNTEARIRWYRWANDERILVSWRFPDIRYGADTVETRLLSVNADDAEDYILLHQPGRREHISQTQDRIVSMLHNDPQHILLALDTRRGNYPDVYRVNVYDGSKERVQKNRHNIRGWMSDRQTRVRIGVSRNYDTGRVTIHHRAPYKNNWQRLFVYNMFDEPPITLVAFDPNPNILYYEAYDGDDEKFYQINLLTGETAEAERHPNYDSSTTDASREEGVALQESVDQALPGMDNSIIDYGPDKNIYLLHSESSTTPDVYYIGDRQANTLELLAERYPELGNEPQYRRKVITYEARDGLKIRALLSLPLHSDGLLPAIIFPHGGPHSRQRRDFDYRVAFFTDRGYAVFSPDFRGSSGYGYEFAQARIRGWGLEMQNDLTDAAHYLVEQGIADRDKLCIVGGSYGGYAAMMATVKTPDLFRCAVSFAGVSDLVQHLADHSMYLDYNLEKMEIGSDRDDLQSRSPYHNVSAIKTPLLLVHGTDDVVVNVEHSRRMAEELAAQGKDVEYIELPHGDHYLSRQENRHAYFQAMDRFLKQHLSP